MWIVFHILDWSRHLCLSLNVKQREQDATVSDLQETLRESQEWSQSLHSQGAFTVHHGAESWSFLCNSLSMYLLLCLSASDLGRETQRNKKVKHLIPKMKTAYSESSRQFKALLYLCLFFAFETPLKGKRKKKK